MIRGRCPATELGGAVGTGNPDGPSHGTAANVNAGGVSGEGIMPAAIRASMIAPTMILSLVVTLVRPYVLANARAVLAAIDDQTSPAPEGT